MWTCQVEMAGVEMEFVFEQSFELQELLLESESDEDRVKVIREYIEKLDKSKLPTVPEFEDGKSPDYLRQFCPAPGIIYVVQFFKA